MKRSFAQLRRDACSTPGTSSGEGISGNIAFSGALPDSFLTHGRPLLTPDESNRQGFVLRAEEQARIALQHSAFLRDSLAGGDLLEAQRHAEHVVNILDGENGSNFGDLNGDGQAQNPGDGFGVQVYLDNAKEGIQLIVDSNASQDTQIYASESTQALDNSQRLLESSIKQAQKVLAADSVAEAQPLADEVERQTNNLLNGSDDDGNGVIEGAILSAYESTQKMPKGKSRTPKRCATFSLLPKNRGQRGAPSPSFFATRKK